MSPVSPIDWPVHDGMFCSEAMRSVVSQRGAISRWVEVERAASAAQGALGIVPADAAEQIVGRLDAAAIDEARLHADMLDVGRPVIGLARQLAEQVGAPHGQWVHYGITTYDVMDSGTALMLRDAGRLLADQMLVLRRHLERLADAHRMTVMVGRTNGQHAQPTTFGLRVAQWIDELLRHENRLALAFSDAATLQLGGMVGTLASVHPDGLALRRAMAERLGLGWSRTNWHNDRDAVAAVGATLGVLGATLARMARDVAALAATDLAEVYESGGEGRGRSSGMPHKRNPRSAEFAESVARLVRHRAAGLAEVMGQEHERSGGTYIAEWVLVPELLGLASGALAWSTDLFERLEPDAERMRHNLEATRGLVLSERYTLELAARIGKFEARALLDRACAEARESDTPLVEVLATMPAVTDALPEAELRALAEPAGYLGHGTDLVDLALDASRNAGAFEVAPSQRGI